MNLNLKYAPAYTEETENQDVPNPVRARSILYIRDMICTTYLSRELVNLHILMSKTL